ncbi:MAG: 30S ribosomal protein S8 [Exilispira sp.]
MYSDPISEMTTKIYNAQMAYKPDVTVSYSKIKESILMILKAKGFIQDFSIESHSSNSEIKQIHVSLKYTSDRKPVINGIRRISKPSRRFYHSVEDIKPIMNGYAVGIYSTNKGILSDKDAKKENVGGEFLFYIW